jgi:hypothetical protein
MCVKTLANCIEVTNALMTISEGYRLCGHKSKPLVVSGVPAASPSPGAKVVALLNGLFGGESGPRRVYVRGYALGKSFRQL